MSQQERDKYSGVAQALHWAVALLIAANFLIADRMQELPLGAAKADLFNLHKSIGLSILALVVLRLLWRQVKPPPALPAELKAWEKRAAHGGHLLLYLTMLALPLSGLVIAFASAFPTVIFGLFELPAPIAPDEDLAERAASVHGFITWLLLALIAVHVAAVLKHEMADRHGYFLRMLPWGK
jgi:cytochrome b561